MAVIGNQTDVNVISGGGGATPVQISASGTPSQVGYTVPAGKRAILRAWITGPAGNYYATNAVAHNMAPAGTIMDGAPSEEATYGPGQYVEVNGNNGNWKGFVGVLL